MPDSRPRRFDLHMHSRHSDGSDSVQDLVRQASLADLAGFSLTDHDTVEGQLQARDLAVTSGLDYITGLELSISDADRDVHLLVYRYDPNSAQLTQKLSLFRRVRRERFHAMAFRLSQLGMELDLRPLGPAEEPSALGRPHLARLLIEQGKVASMREAFDRYLAVGRPAYVPKAALSPAEGIDLGRQAGGVTVLAHPGSYPFQPDLAALVECGLQGVETFYPAWDAQTVAYWRAQARKYNLLETGGSDYHGQDRGHVRLGDATVGEPEWRRLLTA